MTGPVKIEDKVRVYKSIEGYWRWTFIAAENGEILADSGEGYRNRGDCLDALFRVTSVDLRKERFARGVTEVEFWIQEHA